MTVCDEQVAAAASSAKGEPTVALFNGALTLTPLVVLAGAGAGVGAGAVVVLCAVTVMAASATHTAPEVPHAFTCSVCAPAAAVTAALIDVPFTIVVLLLLSSEKPIEPTFWFEQVVAAADSVNCGETFDPLAGALMVTLPSAGSAQIASREKTREVLLIKFTISLFS